MECLKPGGVVILSVSLPWRPAFNTKITHPYYVYNESIVGSKLLANKRHLIHDVLVPPLPQCKAKRYTWCAPPEIPLSFEEAFIQVYNGLRSGGTKSFYTSDLHTSVGGVQYKKQFLTQMKGRPVKICGWTRNPHWIVGTPMSIGHDQATLVLRKEDMSDSLIGFDEEDEDGFD